MSIGLYCLLGFKLLEVKMLRTSIPGLERVFKTDVTPPKVILVTGPPGSLKTSFCYTAMARYLKKSGDFGMYTTLEETSDSHTRNMKGMGIDHSPNMQINDITDLRDVDKLVGTDEETDYIDFIEKQIAHYKQLHGEKFKVYVLDSVGALYSLMENTQNMRKKMFYFFKMLRDFNLLSFAIMERSVGGESQLLGNEGFLVDGIILLGLERSRRGELVRYLQIEKMRACNHSMEKHAIAIGEGGLTVLGPIFEAD